MNIDDIRRREDRAATLFAVTVAGIGCAGALWPLAETVITAALLTSLGLAVLVGGVRTLTRLMRERREDRADTIAGATWRAQHTPRPAVPGAVERRAV